MKTTLRFTTVFLLFLFVSTLTKGVNRMSKTPDRICDVNTSIKHQLRASAEVKPTLNIIALNGNYSSKATIVYDESLSDGSFNFSKDLVKLFSGYEQTPEIFSYLDENRLQLQTINSLANTLSLGIKVGSDSPVKLIVTGMAGFESVSLVDQLTGITYQLTGDTTKIELNITAGTNSDRFYIEFASLVEIIEFEPFVEIIELVPLPKIETGINDNKEDVSLKILTENNRQVVVCNSENAKAMDIFIVDMAGRVTKIQATDDNYNVIDMNSYAAGIYSITVITDKVTESSKIVIR